MSSTLFYIYAFQDFISTPTQTLYANNLEHLEEVVCDEETASLWESVNHVLKNLRIKVHKEDVNLNWIDNHRFLPPLLQKRY
jgi:hypothetical protein